MNTPKLNSFKVRERALLRKKKGLTREIETLWNREIPRKASTAMLWTVLDALVSDLADDLNPQLYAELTSVLSSKDVLGYMEVGASWGSPQKHETPRSYFAAAQVLNLLKKYPWVDRRVDPLGKAVARFYEAEKLCKLANKRLLHYRKFDFASRPLVKRLDVHQIFHLARRKIESWIGSCEFAGSLDGVKHGPGGCVGLKRPHTTPYYKFSVSNYTVSTGAYLYAARAIASSDSWVRSLAISQRLIDWNTPISCVPYETKIRLADQRLEIADYNEVTFVPKDATTHRAIAIEPHVNVALQLAVGNHFRDCLRRAGCDLRDQTRNQELARIGSVQQDVHDPVTLDLRMASDTLPYELVRELMPSDWFEYLDCLRSREGRYKGQTIRWEKFSSMGNGFTFELESMIFYALAQSVSDFLGETTWFADTFGPAYKYAYVSVYGDDIIVPKRLSEHLVAILRFCGFQINHSKSFTTGPFRESCGKDYYNGVLVRPFYFRRGLSHVKDLVHLLNNVKGLEADWNYDMSFSRSLITSWLPMPLTLHLRGPQRTTGDSYIWCEPDECHASFFVVWDTDMQTWTYPVMRPVLTLQRGALHWRYCQFLYGNTGTRFASADPEWSNDQFLSHVSGGGSSGDVVLSGMTGQGKLHLATW